MCEKEEEEREVDRGRGGEEQVQSGGIKYVKSFLFVGVHTVQWMNFQKSQLAEIYTYNLQIPFIIKSFIISL